MGNICCRHKWGHEIVGIGVLQNAASPIFPTDFKIPEILDGATTRGVNVQVYAAKVYFDPAANPRKSRSGKGSLNAPFPCDNPL